MSGVATANDGTNRRGGRDTGRLPCLGTPRAHAGADAEPCSARLSSPRPMLLPLPSTARLAARCSCSRSSCSRCRATRRWRRGSPCYPVRPHWSFRELPHRGPARGSMPPNSRPDSAERRSPAPACAWRAVRSRPSPYAILPQWPARPRGPCCTAPWTHRHRTRPPSRPRSGCRREAPPPVPEIQGLFKRNARRSVTVMSGAPHPR